MNRSDYNQVLSPLYIWLKGSDSFLLISTLSCCSSILRNQSWKVFSNVDLAKTLRLSLRRYTINQEVTDMCARNVHKSRYLGPNRSPQESHHSSDLRCQGSCHKHRRHYPMSPPGADITVMSLTASSVSGCPHFLQPHKIVLVLCRF